MTKTWTCQKPCRLDEFLRERLPEELNSEISNSKIRRLIVAGQVCVDGRQIRIPAYNLRAGAKISATINQEKLFYEKQPDDIDFTMTEGDILYEDDFVIVVNKPVFLPVEAGMVAGRGNLHDALVQFLWSRKPELRNPPYAGIMHRLDRETSGTILFTKTREANKHCHEMFENRSVKKIYRAVCAKNSVAGNFSVGEKFSVEMPMGRISPKSQAAKWGFLPESKGGLHSKTNFTVAGEGELDGIPVYFIDCLLETGRTHQIRVHLGSKKLPILGDTLYGGKKFKRIMLHARFLEFPSVSDGKIVRVEAELTPEFAGR